MSCSRNFHPSRAREQTVTGRRSVYLWVWLTVVFFQAALVISAQAQTIDWIRQFGTGGDEYSFSVSSVGNALYVAGATTGTLPGQTHAGGYDAFVRKYDTSGTEQWTRQFGTSSNDGADVVSPDSSGVYFVGTTEGAFSGQTNSGSSDFFIRKYSHHGTEVWTRQFGSSGYDFGPGVFANGSGVYVIGVTRGALPGQTNSGGPEDAFIRKYDTNGNELWTQQFGTSATDLVGGWGVFADSSGVYVSGFTEGTLPGQTSSGGRDAFIRKYSPTGIELWTRQFGSSGRDFALGISGDGSGVYVGGNTTGTLPGQTSSGGDDVFVRKYDANGNELWTRQFGTTAADGSSGVSATSSAVYVGGNTEGTFPGQTSSGGRDAFVRKYDASGNEGWTLQFGSSSLENSRGIFADGSAVYVGGGDLWNSAGPDQRGRAGRLCTQAGGRLADGVCSEQRVEHRVGD